MCSASERHAAAMARVRALTCAGAVAAIVIAGCRAQPESIGAAAAPPMPRTAAAPAPPIIETPVGPVPGQPAAALREPVNPFGDDEIAMVEGRRLFVLFNCAGCHGGHGGGGMGPSHRDEMWLYGGSDAKIANSIAEGRAHGMPAWGTKLTTEQIWKLTAYLKSLGTPQEPQPPPGS